MFIKQLSVFLENKSGQLEELLKILAAEKINIFSASLADTNDFGVLRILVNDTDRAYKVLKEKGITSKANDVIGVSVPNQIGGLHKVAALILGAGINISYIYGLSVANGGANIVMKTDDQEKTVKLLADNGIVLLRQEDL
ncbi:MAG: amino acid-binding protein [Treponema sp.]|nr:amino acid-binding protein [Treponema sp.]